MVISDCDCDSLNLLASNVTHATNAINAINAINANDATNQSPITKITGSATLFS